MAAARAKKEKPPVGDDDLVRAGAGSYRSGDGRFEVQKSDVGWYLVDTAQENEFGQQLIHGPMATLDAIRAAIPGARDIRPLLRVRPASGATKPTSGTKATAASGSKAVATSKATPEPAPPPPPPPPPPTSWLDKLPTKEAASARRLIRALEKEGIDDAEALVRHHGNDVAPTIANRITEQRLRALIETWPKEDRERAQQLVRAATKILADGGTASPPPMPRWALIEVGDGAELPPRRLRPRP